MGCLAMDIRQREDRWICTILTSHTVQCREFRRVRQSLWHQRKELQMGILYILRENTNDKVIFRMCSDELAGDAKGSTCRCIFYKEKKNKERSGWQKGEKGKSLSGCYFCC